MKLKLLFALATLASSAFGQFQLKDSQATVPFGSGGNLVVCVHDQYGNPVNGAQVYAYSEPPSAQSGFHFHSNVARPNITFDGGYVSAGPKSTAGGCAAFHIIFPKFAGVYFVTTYCTTCENDGLNTFYVKSSLANTFQVFPPGGSLGIVGAYPTDVSLGVTADMAHGNVQKYGSPALISKLQAIGNYYYYHLGVPANQNHWNWQQIIRISLPWGGWLDDIGTITPIYWWPLNPDPHGDGHNADLIWSQNPSQQSLFVNAVTAAGCTTSKQVNTFDSVDGFLLVAYNHVTCF